MSDDLQNQTLQILPRAGKTDCSTATHTYCVVTHCLTDFSSELLPDEVQVYRPLPELLVLYSVHKLRSERRNEYLSH